MNISKRPINISIELIHFAVSGITLHEDSAPYAWPISGPVLLIDVRDMPVASISGTPVMHSAIVPTIMKNTYSVAKDSRVCSIE